LGIVTSYEKIIEQIEEKKSLIVDGDDNKNKEAMENSYKMLNNLIESP